MALIVELFNYNHYWYTGRESNTRQMAYKTIPITTWVPVHIIVLVRVLGLEPRAFRLKVECSSAELNPHILAEAVGLAPTTRSSRATRFQDELFI